MEYYSDCAKNYSVSERLNNTKEKKSIFVEWRVFINTELDHVSIYTVSFKVKLHANLTFVYTEGKYRII